MGGWRKGAKRAAVHNRVRRSAQWRRLFAFELLEPRLALSGAPGLVPVGTQPTGPLSGKIVYTSPGHGWQWLNGAWTTDRANVIGVVEPFGSQDMLTYFSDYLMRAGATVVPMRPVGRQVNEVVLDNDSPGVTYTGDWTDITNGPRWYDEDYGVGGNDAVRFRVAKSSGPAETATATYTPTIPAAGFYPVYTWVAQSSGRALQRYDINHTGGRTQVSVDHSKVGNGWVYLGTYHFDAGSSSTSGSVQITNSTPSGGSVAADAIRFGNGMGDLTWDDNGIGSATGTTSGQPREDEATILWLYRGFGQRDNGETPASVLGYAGVLANVSAPGQMAQHMNADTNPFGTSVYIGLHSNATTWDPNTATARGAIGLVTTNSPTPNQGSLATFVGRQVNVDMRARDGQFENTWSTRTTYSISGAYEEFGANRFRNSSNVVEMDATVAEVAFHDQTQDSQFLRDPKARDQIARSLYEAVFEYFRLVTAGPPADVTLPSAPTSVRATSNAAGQVTVSWAAGPVGGGVGGTYGNAATAFRVYASTDGYGFDGGTLVAGGASTSVTLSGYDASIPYYFKVVAVNAGGESKASEVLGVLPSGGSKQVLIVNGFDRNDRFGDFQYQSIPPRNSGVSERVWARYNNSFDYVVQHVAAIWAARPGVHVASTSNEAVISGAVNLGDYDTVVWILGTEATVDHTFDAAEQTKVANFIGMGGNLFVSGSGIAYDLDAQNNGRTFFQNTLGAGYAADSAGTYAAIATGGSIFDGLSGLTFSNGASFSSLDGQLYNVTSADVLTAQPGSVAALTYSGGLGGTAAVQKSGSGGSGNVVVFGFPFETITDAARRAQVMGRVLEFFGVQPENADFNSDTAVDAGDYVLWRKSAGIVSGAVESQGDANHDGAVNSTDYDIWRAQFGTSPAMGAASLESAAVGSAEAGGDVPQSIVEQASATSSGFVAWDYLGGVSAERSPALRRPVAGVAAEVGADLLNALPRPSVLLDAMASHDAEALKLTMSSEFDAAEGAIDCVFAGLDEAAFRAF